MNVIVETYRIGVKHINLSEVIIEKYDCRHLRGHSTDKHSTSQFFTGTLRRLHFLRPYPGPSPISLAFEYIYLVQDLNMSSDISPVFRI